MKSYNEYDSIFMYLLQFLNTSNMCDKLQKCGRINDFINLNDNSDRNAIHTKETDDTGTSICLYMSYHILHICQWFHVWVAFIDDVISRLSHCIYIG